MKKYYLLSLLILTILPLSTYAEGTTLFPSSGSGGYLVGKSFTTRIVLNSGSNDINAAESVLKFDPKYIKVEKITKDKSIFQLWTTEPKFSNTDGTITFGGGSPSKFKDSAGVILNLTIKPLQTGTTSIEVSSLSLILKADGEGMNIFSLPNKTYYFFGSNNTVAKTNSLTTNFSGSILIQVEESGKAWYVNPNDKRRYYLGRPADAFNLMRKLGLGVTHKYLTTYQKGIFPKTMSGKILLDVEDFGKAYYINPDNRQAYYLGRPADAFGVMRELGKGINNEDINRIPDWAI